MKETISAENKRTLREDPQYFGAFLNMARHNIYTINNHLASKFNIKPLSDEEKIKDSFLSKKDQTNYKRQQSAIYAQLKRFLPIVKIFDDEMLPKAEQIKKETKIGKRFDELSDTLLEVFKELHDFRNDYTHYYSTETGNSRKEKVSEKLKAFLERSFQLAILYTQERFKEVFTEQDFALANNTEIITNDNTITQDGFVFLITLFLDRENAFQFINKITGLKGTQHKSFLAKREVLSAYCIQLPHQKFISENPIQAFSLELINELNKCPKELYHVITDAEKKQFQPQLEEQQINNITDNSVPETIDDYETYIQSITKRIRHENRFSYFALKFLDEKKIFSKLRFQIDLGKVILDQYTKPLNGAEEPRKVVEHAKAFGRLHEIRNQEEDILKKINSRNCTTVFEQFAPHYNFDNNKIGICFSGEKTAIVSNQKNTDKKVKTLLQQPEVEAFLSTNELQKILLLEYLEQGKTETIIQNFINRSATKLFDLEFIEDIKAQLSDLSEFKKRSQGRKAKWAYTPDSLKELQRRKQELNKILESHALNDKQIPSRILEYWLNITDVEGKTAVSDAIKGLKRDCIDRLKDIEKGRMPKIGEMATFLARDIVKMIVDENKKEKITSFYYDKMQECLALFADTDKKNLFIQICHKELGLNDKGGHPFLHKINLSQFRHTSDLYKAYLEEKGRKMIQQYNSRTEKDQSWLEVNFYKKEWDEKKKRKMTVVKLPENLSGLPFSLRQLAKEKNTFKKWFKNITKKEKDEKNTNDRKKPIDLPTNLFDTPLKEALQKELKEKNIPFNADHNYSKLFQLWWSKCREDQTQEFYTAEREYIFQKEKLCFHINTKNQFSDYYKPQFLKKIIKLKKNERKEEQKTNKRLPDIDSEQVEKAIRNRIAETEKQIRILQEEDRLLLLLFEQLTDHSLNLKLENISKLLNETISVKETITGTLSFNDMGEIIDKNTKKETITRSITEDRKRKEYSVLKKYIFDRRLPELFEYFKEETLPMETVKKELDAYNKAKDRIFDAVFKMEQTIINTDEETIRELNVNFKGEIQTGNIPHKPYLYWLLQKEMITEQVFTFMNMVRNTFSHNQFPQKTTMEQNIIIQKEKEIATQIAEKYITKIKELQEQLIYMNTTTL